MKSLLWIAFGAVSAAANPSPLACQPNSEQPMLPIFHVIFRCSVFKNQIRFLLPLCLFVRLDFFFWY